VAGTAIFDASDQTAEWAVGPYVGEGRWRPSVLDAA
jgi:hypothetical protein